MNHFDNTCLLSQTTPGVPFDFQLKPVSSQVFPINLRRLKTEILSGSSQQSDPSNLTDEWIDIIAGHLDVFLNTVPDHDLSHYLTAPIMLAKHRLDPEAKGGAIMLSFAELFHCCLAYRAEIELDRAMRRTEPAPALKRGQM